MDARNRGSIPLFVGTAILLLLISVLTFSGLTMTTSNAEVSIPETRAGTDYNFTILCENNSHLTNGGEETGYFIEINNTGTTQDTIVVSYEIISVTGGEEPDINDWFVRLEPDQVTLQPGEAKVVILRVTTTCTCQEGSTAVIRVTGGSGNDPSKVGYVDTYTTRGPTVGEQQVKIELEDVSVFFELSAGQNLSFNLKVTNLQTVAQSYVISNVRKPKDWPLDFIRDSFEVPQKSKKIIEVRTQIPQENEPGIVAFRFDVESVRDPTISDSFQTPIDLLPELSVKKFTVLTETPIVDESVVLQIEVENLGTALARDIDINLYNGTAFEPQFVINTDKIPQLKGNESVILNFSMTPRSVADYNITVFIDPDGWIEEVANRLGNNFLTKRISVNSKPPEKPPNNGSNGASNGLSDYLLPIIGTFVGIVIVLILIYFLLHRARTKKENERMAHKIPLSRSVGERRRRKSGGKKARKEKL
jgi:uncharacterized membrane protein